MTLANKVDQFIADADKIGQVANGDKNTVVQTGAGPVPSVSKLLADSQAAITQAVDAQITLAPRLAAKGGAALVTTNSGATVDAALTALEASAKVHDVLRDASAVKPNSYPHGVRYEFVNGATIGAASPYGAVQTIAPYEGQVAGGGGQSYQVGYGGRTNGTVSAPIINYRTGIETSWQGWWTAMLAGGLNLVGQDLNKLVVPGSYRVENGTLNLPAGAADYGNLLVLRGTAYDTITQIYGDYVTGGLFVRGGNPTDTGGSGAWGPWREVLDGRNYNNYAPRKDGTGAGGTWNINVTGSAYCLSAGYVSGGMQKPNAGMFGGARVVGQMLHGSTFPSGAPNEWVDALWVSGYAGSDVKPSHVLVFGKQGSEFIGFARQDYDAGAWGAVRRILTDNQPTINKPTIKGYIEQFQQLNPGGTVTLDPTLGTLIELTATANMTITLPAAVAGVSFTLIVLYNGNPTLQFTGGTAIRWAGGAAPAATSVAGKMDKYQFTCGSTYTLAQDGGRNF